MPTPSRSARPLILGLAVLGGVVVLAAAVVSFANAVPGNLDDAFITLVYARHLVEDQALYWNLHDGRIDGFTSLLDVLLKAALLTVADDPLAAARDLALGAQVLGAVVAATVVAATGPTPGRGLPMGAGIVVGLAVGLHPAPAHGASFLLESPIFVVLAVAAVGMPLALDLRERRAARRAFIAVLVLACLVRPEGQALALLLSVLYAAVLAPEATPRVRFGPLLGVVLVLVLYYGWHQLYFGSLLPNTFHAKSSASRGQELAEGWAYLVAFGRDYGALGWLSLTLPLLVPLPLLSGRWRHPPARARHLLPSAAALASLLMVIWEGGDSYSGGRFLAVPTVLLIVACGHLATSGPRWPRVLAWTGLVAVAGLGTLHQLAAFARGAPSSSIAASMDDYRCEQQAARQLAAVAPNATVMQTDWQRLAWFTDGLRVIDLHGLNDREIARLPVEGPVRYGKFTHAHALTVGAPVWVYGHRLASDVPMAAVPMVMLLTDPAVASRFVGYVAPADQVDAIAAAYVPASIPVCGRYFNVLVRREHAAALASAGLLVGDGQGRVSRLGSP